MTKTYSKKNSTQLYSVLATVVLLIVESMLLMSCHSSVITACSTIKLSTDTVQRHTGSTQGALSHTVWSSLMHD